MSASLASLTKFGICATASLAGLVQFWQVWRGRLDQFIYTKYVFCK